MLAPAGWTGEQAARAISGLVNLGGLPIYAFSLRRMDLYGTHWVIVYPDAACRGWSESAARVADFLHIPPPGGEGVAIGSDLIIALQGFAGLLGIKAAQLAADVKEERTRRQEEGGPASNRPEPAGGPAPSTVPPMAAPDSVRFKFRPEDIKTAEQASSSTAGAHGLDFAGIE
jgi:hypothetical protein